MYTSHVGMVTVEDAIRLWDNVDQSKNVTEAGAEFFFAPHVFFADGSVLNSRL